MTISRIAILLVALLLVMPFGLEAADVRGAPDEILVGFKSYVTDAKADEALATNGADVIEGIPAIRVKRARVRPGQTVEQVIARLERHPLVRFAEPNGMYEIDVVPNDPRYPDQWAPPKINAPQAWDYTIGTPGGLIAILDTGVNYAHPDLKVVLGPDYVNGDSDPMDDHGHGTRMAGIAGAYGNNGVGVAGLDWLADILAIKVCGSDGKCTWSNLAKGITYAVDNGARVLSISLGGSSGSSTLQNALQYAWGKGAVISCSAGNSNSNGAHYPSDYKECISVGATDSNDNKASFSNWGLNLEVMAPGVSILTTSGSGYGTSTGTSPAAPHVAGLASLLFGLNPNLDNCRTREIMQSTAKDLGAAGWDQYYGYGRIDAYAAAVAAIGQGPSCGAPPPSPTGKIVGTVTGGGQPITGASIVGTGPKNWSAISGSDGHYSSPGDLPSGSYSVTASATGYASQTKSASVDNDTVTVDFALQASEPPPGLSVKIVSPADGATVGGKVYIEAEAVGAVKVEFYVDGARVGEDSNAPYSTFWQTKPKKWTPGVYVIKAVAYDAAGNRAESSVTVTLAK